MIISNRHIDKFKPQDEIPEGYFDADCLAKLVASTRVTVSADDEQASKAPEDMTVTELKEAIDAAGIKVSKRSKKAMIEALS